MTFQRLGPVVAKVVGRIVNEVGLDGVGAPSDAVNVAKSRKRTRTEARAKFREEVSQEAEGNSAIEVRSASRVPTDTTLPMGRRMTVATASPKAVGCPTRAAVIRLVIDNGGGPARTQGGVRPGRLRASTGGGSREREFLKLVVG